MKLLFLTILLLVKQPIFATKMDIGLLLVIESSVQNKDFDILCALRESLVNLTKQNSTRDEEFDVAILCIDQLYQCIHTENVGVQNLTTYEPLQEEYAIFEPGKTNRIIKSKMALHFVESIVEKHWYFYNCCSTLLRNGRMGELLRFRNGFRPWRGSTIYTEHGRRIKYSRKGTNQNEPIQGHNGYNFRGSWCCCMLVRDWDLFCWKNLHQKLPKT